MAPNDGMDRRTWLRLAAMSAAFSAAHPLQAKKGRTLGVQLYTVREQLGDRADATLKAIASIGYQELEVLRGDLAAVVPIAKRYGLAPVSAHIEGPFVTGNWEAWGAFRKLPEGYSLERALDEMRAHGVRYAVVSYLMPAEREGSQAFYEKLAASLNRAGELARKAGVTLGYHNHAFELDPLPDGRRPLDVLVSGTDPALVKLELDVFWVGVTGADPAEAIQRYKGRVELLHLKDRAADAPRVTDERQVPPTAFREVGSGSLDFRAILKAADAAGVKHFFVEQDHTPGDPLGSLRQSYQYLSTLA